MTVTITKKPQESCPTEKSQISKDDLLNEFRRTQRLNSNSPLTENSSCGDFLAVINHKRKCLTFEYYPVEEFNILVVKIFNNTYYNELFTDPQPNLFAREEYILVDSGSRKALWRNDFDQLNSRDLIAKWLTELVEE